MKNILLTGVAGFVGSNLAIYLINKYPHIHLVGLDRLDACSSIKNFEEIKDEANFTFVKGDIRSSDLILFVLKSYQIDTIVHAAALSHVDTSFGNSFQFTESNVIGTHVLLECAKSTMPQIKVFLHMSTDEIYGGNAVDCKEHEAFTEENSPNASNPYSASKAAAEMIVKAYYHSFGLPVVITRSNNLIGRFQHPEKLVPKFTTLLSRGLPCPLHGDGLHRRSFLCIDDACTAFDLILEKGKIGETYNIGTPNEIANLDTLKCLIRIFRTHYSKCLDPSKPDDYYIEHVRDRVFNDARYLINCSKLEALGWTRQNNDFEQVLKATVDWYMQNPNHWPTIEHALMAHPCQLEQEVANLLTLNNK